MSTTPLGTVAIENNRATLTFSRLVKASPSRTWDAIVSPVKFGAWYNATVEIEPRA